YVSDIAVARIDAQRLRKRQLAIRAIPGHSGRARNHHSAGESDGGRRSDGDLHGHGHGHGTRELPVGEYGTAIGGATADSYTTPATTTADDGDHFTVVVSNAVGSVTSSPAALTVNAAPVAPTITTQPASQTVSTGQRATFTVTATGT